MKTDTPMTAIAGMTLLECLVALAILAIALTAAFRAIGATALSAGMVRDATLASWVAQNQLAEMRARNVYPPLGRSEGSARQGNINYLWRQTVEATQNPLFRKVDVQVFDESGQRPLSSITGFAVMPLR